MILILNDEVKYSTLYDHYKETISYLKGDLAKRDKLTWILFSLLIVYFLVEFKTVESINIANFIVKDKLGESILINYNLLVTAMLLSILLITMKYFQLCLNIEKQYSYIHNIEDKLNSISEERLITREGYSYLKEYPLLSALLHRIYVVFLPVGIITSMVIKINMLVKNPLSIVMIFNIVIGSAIIVITFLYILFSFRNVKFIRIVNKIIKKLFILLHLYEEEGEGETMAKKKVCISFDYENDRNYKNLLVAWDANSNFEFSFNDLTPTEINSNNYSRVKAVITQKISAATYLLVIVGEHANDEHPRKNEIGDRNWLNWEINKAKQLGKKLVAVKIDRSNKLPTALMGAGASLAMSFTKDAIIKALNEA